MLVTPGLREPDGIRMHCARHFSPAPVGRRSRTAVCEADRVTGPAPDGAPPPMPDLRPGRGDPDGRAGGDAAALRRDRLAGPARGSPRPSGGRGRTTPRTRRRGTCWSARCPTSSLGVALAVSAWFLPQHRRWARWTGLAASFLLAGLMLLGMASIGGVTPISLLVLVLSVAAVTSLLARPTGGWVAGAGARP